MHLDTRLRNLEMCFTAFNGLEMNSGEGVYPSCDAFGNTFSPTFDRERHRLAGQRIAGDFVACLDGIQADQEFVAKLFRPTRH